jgi:hypothetical protein
MLLTRWATLALTIVLAAGCVPLMARRASSENWTLTRLSGPDRTVVTNEMGAWVATFTDNAHAVTLAGPQRTLTERMLRHEVVTTTYVRVLPRPFNGKVDPGWLTQALTSKEPDILAISLEYLHGSESIFDEDGRRIAGDAQYGPLNQDGLREEGADFQDYLGVSWTYEGKVRRPVDRFAGSLDCSGYIRMIWGMRGGLPVARGDSDTGIPRRSFEIARSGPGVEVLANTGKVPQLLDKLSPGDLVFFDADTTDGSQIDHVGMFVGKDTGGHYRFISSRKTNDGPTMGDFGGASILDGNGKYAEAFRLARRL